MNKKIENVLFWVIVSSFLIASCGKEPQPAFLNGNFKAEIFELLDCNDVSSNVSVDFSKDSVYLFNCDTLIVNCDTSIVNDTFFVDTTLTAIDTIIIDTIIMGCEELLENCNEAIYNEVLFSIDSINGSYKLTIDRDFDGVNERTVQEGNFISEGFNDLFLCETNCLDSLWAPGVYTFLDGELNLSWRDTIQTGCGYFFKGGLN